MPAVVPFETAPQMFRRLAARYAGSGKAVLRHKDKATGDWHDISWDALDAQVRHLAAFLTARGVRPGDRVALLSENRPEWAVTDLATQLIGAVTVAVYPTLPADQVAYIVRDSGARVLVVSTRLQLGKAVATADDCPDLETLVSMSSPKRPFTGRAALVLWDAALAEGTAARDDAALDAVADAVTPDSLSALIYTSGTTGEPKGVMMTQENLLSNVRAVHERIGVREDDVHLSFLPLSHAFERTAGYTTVLSAGATIAYAESVDAVAKNLPEVNPTLLVSVPRLFERVYATIRASVQASNPLKRGLFAWSADVGTAVAARRRDGRAPGPLLAAQHALAHRLVFSALHEKLGGRVRLAVSGGAALPSEVGAFFEAAGLTIVEGYGLSETAPVLAANPPEAPVFGTVGWVFPDVTVAIRDLHSGRIIGQLTGRDAPSPLTTGAGEILAKGPNIMSGYWGRPEDSADVFDAEGWFRTGDVGRFENGYLRITDRIKHMIVSKGGKNIYPGPIEKTLGAHPLVEQIVVLGEGREFLTALVVPDLDAVRAEAKAAGLSASSAAELLADAHIQAQFASALRTYSMGAASHEKVRDFRLIEEPFSVENELLTPTLKPKRKAIEARYADLTDAMYA